MGSNQGLFAKPEHISYLDDYYIDRYLVTNEMFMRFVSITRYKSEGNWKKYFSKNRLQHPVINITWNDAIRYAEWAGKSLPTEPQWEKAARGINGLTYPWGNQWDPERCNCWQYNEMHYSKITKRRNFLGTSEVGVFEDDISPFGCNDMCGNVSEWIFNNYYPYITPDPEDNETRRSAKVIRGGNWRGDSYITFTCYNRFFSQPDRSSNVVGFRCVKHLSL